MDRLSSCYFCGTALDDGLTAYQIGPPEASTEVVLCETCRRKIEPILEAAVAGAEGDSTTAAPPDPERSEPSPEPPEPTPSDDEEAEEPARTTVSALENSKVMRLLQNREFPVDRAEFERMAANAYGLAESDCAQVIDLAIERGLLVEDGGQLEKAD